MYIHRFSRRSTPCQTRIAPDGHSAGTLRRLVDFSLMGLSFIEMFQRHRLARDHAALIAARKSSPPYRCWPILADDGERSVIGPHENLNPR
jgi:hypothetical protein